MKDQEVPDRKGIHVFYKKANELLNFTSRCYFRVQSIKREVDGSYIKREQKVPQLGIKLELSSSTFAVVTTKRADTLLLLFIIYLVKVKGFRKVKIRTRKEDDGKKHYKKIIIAYASPEFEDDEFSSRVCVEFRRYKRFKKNKTQTRFEISKSLNIVGIDHASSVSKLLQGFFFSLGFKREYVKYS